MKYDFSGWATRNGLQCSDGRTIMRDAFKDNDGQVVPLVWNHQHNEPYNVLGHALLENRDEGVYAYCAFNDTEQGNNARELVEHGDVSALSIYANRLKQNGGNVLHGAIREVSLVLAGANPGAYIDTVLTHGDGSDDSAVIYTGEPLHLAHADDEDEEEEDDGRTIADVINEMTDKQREVVMSLFLMVASGQDISGDSVAHADADGETVDDVFKTLTKEQQEVVLGILGKILNEREGEDDMAHSDIYDELGDVLESLDDDQFDIIVPFLETFTSDGLSHADDDIDDEALDAAFESLTDDQRDVILDVIEDLTSDDDDEDYEDYEDYEEDSDDMKHNVFDATEGSANVLSHSDMQTIFADAKRCGSLRDAVLQHMEDGVLSHVDTTGMDIATGNQSYGFNDPDMLFPDYKSLNNPPEWIKRDTDWVSIVMNGVHHTPFSRIKSMYANITEDEARAKGYIKGKQKKEEVFTTLKRTTDPQTIYKKQKLDRDDVVDITDFDVVAWIKAEMRVMLDEEIARAILIGDGRNSDSDDKIQEAHVRPIATDVPLFNIKVNVDETAAETASDKAKIFIDSVIRARKNYKGSGNPTLFTTEDQLTECLLIEDGIGHKIYKSVAELATTLRVSRIVTVEVMENQKVDGKDLMGIIVNLADYNVGADKGGAISMFDDFDIDYNQQKYLIETRISGALTKPYSAMTILRGAE